MNNIAAIVVALQKALHPEFKAYAAQVLRNAQVAIRTPGNTHFALSAFAVAE